MTRLLFVFGLVLSLAFYTAAQGGTEKKGKVNAQTQFTAAVEKVIDAESSSVGDDLNFKLAEDLKGDGITILKGSEILGRIVSIEQLSAKNKASRVSIMFDFVQSGEDFMPCAAVIVGIEQLADDVKLERSKAYEGSTVLSLQGKNIKIGKGKLFRIKLVKDLTPY